ncbi:MAG: nucleotidyl transferase AbiEii/AbiGii toxin family protein [Deltaproteobacteria bacterium]|nr:nucleotidyl transferase AbiEii/AbiGii toxin family protein [Deltaproteobacteria bacterium]
MHESILAPDTARVLIALSAQSWLSAFYLAGGTAIALRLGHRRSVDLDFMAPQPIDTLQLRQLLAQCGPFILDHESAGTVHGTLAGVKVSFLEYRYPRLDPGDHWHGVAIAALSDLACMKLEAIAARGKKRDFYDVYAIAQTGHSVRAMFDWFVNKYQAVQYNQVHIVKSLTYFADAENDPEPMLITPIAWDAVKAFFEREARALIP